MWQAQRTRCPKPHPRRCAHGKLLQRDPSRQRKLRPARKQTAIRARPRSASPQNRRGTQRRSVSPPNRCSTQRRNVSLPNRCSRQRRSGLPRNRDSRLRRSVSPPNRRSTQRRSVLPRNRGSTLSRSGSPPSRRSTHRPTVPPQNRRRAQSLASAEAEDGLPARRRRTKSQNQRGRDLGQTCAPRHLVKVDCSFTKSFVVPRGGMPRLRRINQLECQTGARAIFEAQRLSGALANHSRPPSSRVRRSAILGTTSEPTLTLQPLDDLLHSYLADGSDICSC